MHLVWALTVTSPYAKDVPSFSELMNRDKEEEKPKQNLGLKV